MVLRIRGFNCQHFKLIIVPFSLMGSCCSLPLNLILKPMIFSSASRKFLNRLIQDFSTNKKPKPSQENRRFNLPWKEFVQERWRCSEVKNWQMLPHYYLSK